MARIVAAFIAILVVAAPYAAEAVNCIEVSLDVTPCIIYALGITDEPSKECCAGVSSLMSHATTKADHQIVCRCLKTLAIAKGISDGPAANIPSLCQVTVPWVVSMETDCNMVEAFDGSAYI